MAWSKESRIKLFIAVDIVFFLIEIVVGYTAHSLALVADAFHMLNDVISLCVGLWAVRVASTRSSSYDYTYGWARAEILGGLVNGVFLVALCLTIFLEALQRFFEPQEVSNPKLVLIVGGIGLAFNILGLFVFHQHSHSHGDEHDHDHEHGESDGLIAAEAGESHAHVEGTSTQSKTSKTITNGTAVPTKSQSVQNNNQGEPDPSSLTAGRAGSRSGRHSSAGLARRHGSRSYGFEDVPIHPGFIRDEIISQARMQHEGEDNEQSSGGEEAVDVEEASERSPLLKSISSPRKNKSTSSTKKPQVNGNGTSHHEHKHNQPRSKGSGGHGHSHGDMNIRGMFLHVLGDALGNVGVMASALIIWLTAPWYPRFYFDPAISLLITAIILKTAIPLVKETAKPLLQAVPEDVSIADIKEDIESLPGIRSCHHLHVWALTPSKRIATLDVCLDFDYDAQKYMQLAVEVKKCLHGFGIHSSTIQPEFSNRADEVCQLDCLDGPASDNKCCTPAATSGTATPRDGGSDGHGHDHDGHDHGHNHSGHSH